MPSSRLRECNSVVKDASKVDILFGYCYPSTYRSGMTGLALHIFYNILNAREDTSCERYFRHQTRSPAKSIETGRDLRDNHLLGFTLTYEEDIINLIQMLTAGNIPIKAEERGAEDPIVIVGGPVVTANPEPYVDFVDGFVIGEGDLAIHEIVDVVKEAESREAAIEALGDLQGVYVPRIDSAKVQRLIIDDLDSLVYPLAQIIPELPEDPKMAPVFGKTFLLEVTRGCGHSCRFCLVGHVCRPRRNRSFERLKEIVQDGLGLTPVNKVSLIGSSLGDMDALEDLVCWIVENEHEVSVPSLRADSVTEPLLDCLVKGGQRTLTIAPETGSDKLRRIIGKGLDDDDIYRAIDMAEEAGYRSLKLYFVIGLPGEEKEDIEETGKMIARISRESKLRVTASINPFIPKAQTRWERESQPEIDELRRRLRLVRDELKGEKVALETLDLRGARIQAALSIGGRNLGKVIMRAAEYGGYGGWRRAERETGIEVLSLASNPSHLEHGLPWQFLK